MITGANIITGAPTAEQNTLRGYHVSLTDIDETLPAHNIDDIDGLRTELDALSSPLGGTATDSPKLTKLDANGWPIGSYCILRAVYINNNKIGVEKPCPPNFNSTSYSYFKDGSKKGIIWISKGTDWVPQGVYNTEDEDENKVGVYADDDNSAQGYNEGSLDIQFCCKSDD